MYEKNFLKEKWKNIKPKSDVYHISQDTIKFSLIKGLKTYFKEKHKFTFLVACHKFFGLLPIFSFK